MGSNNFSTVLDSMLGYYVNLYVGEDIRNGKLIGVESDYVTLEDENNYVYYYSLDKIQAITKNTKQFQSDEITTDFLKTPSLTEVLSSLRESWVTIICSNNVKFNGILSHLDDDFATLISGEERIVIRLNNIANVFKGYLKDENNEEDNSDSNTAENIAKNRKGEGQKEKTVEETPEAAKTVVVNKSAKDEIVWSQSIKNAKQKYAADTPKMRVEEENKKITDTINIKEEVKVEDEPGTNIKIFKGEDEKPAKVWSQPVKNFSGELHEATSEINTEMKKKKIEAATEEINTDMEKKKVETAPASQKQEKKEEKTVVTRVNQIQDTKKEKVSLESKNTRKKDEKKMVFHASNESRSSEKQKAIVQKKEKELVQFSSIKQTSKELNNKKYDDKPKEQPANPFRFLGEPVNSREQERDPIFRGWPIIQNPRF